MKKANPIIAAAALEVIETGKSAENILANAGLNADAAPMVNKAIAEMTTSELYACLPPIRRASFAKYAPKN